MSSCPVPYTCPLIDEVIDDHVKWAYECLEELKEHVEDADIQSDIAHILHHFDPVPILEKIREANSDLREWGEREEEEKESALKTVEDLETQLLMKDSQIRDLDAEVNRLNRGIEDLEEKVNRLNREIDDLEYRNNY